MTDFQPNPTYRVPPQDGAPFSEWQDYFQWANTFITQLQAEITAALQAGSPIDQETLNSYCHRADGLLEYYRRFNQHAQAEALLTTILGVAELAAPHQPRFTLQLLNAPMVAQLDALRRDPAVLTRYQALSDNVIGRVLLHDEFDFWLFLSALEISRSLAQTDPERHLIDNCLVRTRVAGANVVFSTNPDLAVEWLSEAAQLAQTRLNDRTLAQELLAEAQATRAAARITSRLPNAESLLAELEAILQQGLRDRHGQRFLPHVSELVARHIAELQGGETLIGRLLQDPQLLINMAEVKRHRRAFEGRGLASFLSAQRIDNRGNLRGWDEPDSDLPYREQYTAEVMDAVSAILANWQQHGRLALADLMEVLQRQMPGFDWRLVERGLERCLAGDFASAIHLLATQFESVFIYLAGQAGLPTVRYDQHNREMSLYLYDLLTPDRADVRAWLGEGLFELTQIFLVESKGAFNVRNKVAHGSISPIECNHAIASGLLFLLLHLVQHAPGQGQTG